MFIVLYQILDNKRKGDKQNDVIEYGYFHTRRFIAWFIVEKLTVSN